MKAQFELQPGKYVICDPCYAIDEDKWISVLKKTRYFGSFKDDTFEVYNDKEDQGGVFELNGHKLYCHSTAYGDGIYESNIGERFDVDTGMIACIPLEMVGGDAKGEYVHEFSLPFTCSYENGTFRFGGVEIYT